MCVCVTEFSERRQESEVQQRLYISSYPQQLLWSLPNSTLLESSMLGKKEGDDNVSKSMKIE